MPESVLVRRLNKIMPMRQPWLNRLKQMKETPQGLGASWSWANWRDQYAVEIGYVPFNGRYRWVLNARWRDAKHLPSVCKIANTVLGGQYVLTNPNSSWKSSSTSWIFRIMGLKSPLATPLGPSIMWNPEISSSPPIASQPDLHYDRSSHAYVNKPNILLYAMAERWPNHEGYLSYRGFDEYQWPKGREADDEIPRFYEPRTDPYDVFPCITYEDEGEDEDENEDEDN